MASAATLDELAIAAARALACAPVVVVAGHYGVGKTNLSLNVALDAARAGKQVTLVDLDVVNPYFRSSEYRALLEEHGVELVAPVFAEAGSSLDVPSLTGGVVPAIERAQRAGGEVLTLIDAGGDDAGATALGRFAELVAREPYALLSVVNCFRNLTQEPSEALAVLREIEAKAHLRATAVVSNAHVGEFTDAEAIGRGVRFAREVAAGAGLPLAGATVPKWLLRRENDAVRAGAGDVTLYPVETYVRAPWN